MQKTDCTVILGSSISYDRVLSLEDKIASSLCDRYEQDEVVLPACFIKGLFMSGAIDNLDYNPSSTTFRSSFHGTGISLFQFPMKDNPGIVRTRIPLPDSINKNYSLPNSYEIVLWNLVTLLYQGLAALLKKHRPILIKQSQNSSHGLNML